MRGSYAFYLTLGLGAEALNRLLWIHSNAFKNLVLRFGSSTSRLSMIKPIGDMDRNLVIF